MTVELTKTASSSKQAGKSSRGSAQSKPARNALDMPGRAFVFDMSTRELWKLQEGSERTRPNTTLKHNQLLVEDRRLYPITSDACDNDASIQVPLPMPLLYRWDFVPESTAEEHRSLAVATETATAGSVEETKPSGGTLEEPASSGSPKNVDQSFFPSPLPSRILHLDDDVGIGPADRDHRQPQEGQTSEIPIHRADVVWAFKGTGSSKGAASAVYAAWFVSKHLRAEIKTGQVVVYCIPFAAPMMGDKAAIEEFNRHGAIIQHIALDVDPVPDLRHAKGEQYMERDYEHTLMIPLHSFARAHVFDRETKKLLFTGLSWLDYTFKSPNFDVALEVAWRRLVPAFASRIQRKLLHYPNFLNDAADAIEKLYDTSRHGEL
ncbi:lipase domain-containing protein [Cyclospora cayetanensis]|uniref:Lipase domain-containing protein n=1 Tax=Cyclospora cayetanensis TaxID=88456 RepID=A0A1D3D4J5_9EIME|nr:lipase domain-containing protein [Cyclospora cayetanensis]